jgi:hypothetical protein
MFKKIALGIGAALALFLGYVAVKSPDYVISREIQINATADKIFPYVNNPKLMNEWNPWSELDPQAKMSYTGPAEGVGSRTNWEGGKQLGTGSATVVESVANQVVRTRIEYVEPFKMAQDSELLMKPATGGTTVVWTVRGKNSFMGRLMCTFMNMDKMVGGTFEKGLTSLKNKVEK